MKRRKFLLGTAGAAGALTIGSVAYTEAVVNRDVDVTVVKDDDTDAALRLNPGPAGGTEVDDQSQLRVTGEADGTFLTPDGTFTFGDSDSPTSEYAFSMTNNLAEAREYTVISAIDQGDAVFNLDFYDSDGINIGGSASAEIVDTEETEVYLYTKASIDDEENDSITITVYEDTDPADDTTEDLTATRDIPDGETTFELPELEFGDESEVWLEAEFEDDEGSESPVLEETALQGEDGTEIQNIDSAGEVVPLGAGEVAYTVMTIETTKDTSDINGTIEISSSANEDFN